MRVRIPAVVPGPLALALAAGLALAAAACGDGGGGRDVPADAAPDPGGMPDPGTFDPGTPDPGPGDPGTPDPGPADPGGDPGAAAIVPGEPVELDPQVVVGEALEPFASWDRNDVPYLSRSRCGDWGVLFREVAPRGGGQVESALVFATALPGGGIRRDVLDPRPAAAVPIQFGWGLVHDAECVAHAIQAHAGGYREWTRPSGADATWSDDAPLAIDLAMALGGQPDGLSHQGIGVDRDAVPHLVFTAVMPDASRPLVHAWRGTSSWVAVRVGDDGPAPADWLAFAFGRKGAELSKIRPGIHVLVRTPGGGLACRWFNDEAWQPEEAVWTPGSGEVVSGAGIAMGAYDLPVVAFTVETRGEGGILLNSALHWATRSASGTWTAAMILDQGAEYVGKRTTGFEPMPVVDDRGGSHVVFLDRVALIDGETTLLEDAGSLRYGYRQGTGAWRFATLLPQVAPGAPDESPQAAMRHPAVAVSPDGTGIVAAGMAIETDLRADRRTLRLLAVPAENGLAPRDP